MLKSRPSVSDTTRRLPATFLSDAAIYSFEILTGSAPGESVRLSNTHGIEPLTARYLYTQVSTMNCHGGRASPSEDE